MAYVSDSNLTQFWGLAKDYINAEDGRFANWQKTEKAGAVTCWPVGGTELRPTVDFLFSETGPESGDKGPDNPSTITGVTQAKVTRCGKNIISKIAPQTRTNNGVTFAVDSQGFITTSGTATGGNANFFYDMPPNALDIPVVKGHTYTISGCPQGGSSSTYCITTALFSKSGTVISYNVLNDAGNGKTWTATDDGYLWVVVLIGNGYDSTGLVFKPQIEESSIATSYEFPERNLYTLPLGSTFYGGSIDFATGVMTVTHEIGVITSQTSISTTSAECVFRTGYIFSPAGDSQTVCTHFSVVMGNPSPSRLQNGECALRSDGLAMFKVAGISDLDTFKSWVYGQYNNGTPVTLAYKLATPTTVQLDPTQILSLAQPDKYTPRLNTVYTDASAVQVGYAKSPIRSEYELTQAIIATEGGE